MTFDITLTTALVFALFLAAGCALLYIENGKFKLVEYVYKSDKLLADEFCAVVLSDLHNYEYGKDNERLMQAIRTVNPDAVLIAGDMIESEKGKQIATTMVLLKRLAAEFPVYYGVGNHESKVLRFPEKFGNMFEELELGLKEAGLHIMRNEIAWLPDFGIRLYCVELEHAYYRRFITRHLPEDYMQKRFGAPDEDMLNILLAHNPEHFPDYAKWGADFVLSGHIHGGIIRVPGLGGAISPQMKLFPKYDGGEFKEGNSVMILSRGIGTHTLPVRILNRAELVVLRIKKG